MRHPPQILSMIPSNVTSVTTQHAMPSTMASRAGSPTPETAPAITTAGTAPIPPTLTTRPHIPATSTGSATTTLTASAPKPTLQEMTQAGAFLFDLSIAAVKQASINYDPRDAVLNLNASIQEAACTETGIEDLPLTLFRVIYNPPPPYAAATEHGYYQIRVPAPLREFYIKNTPPLKKDGPLAFTGDDKGNAYKLLLKAHTKKTFKAQDRIPEDTPWCHVIADKDSEIGMRELYTLSRDHLASFGLNILDHPDAFKMIADASKEQGAGKAHVFFDIKFDTVPTTNGLYDLRGITRFIVDHETNERAGVWIKPEVLAKEFNICSKCLLNFNACPGHDPTNKKRDMPAATKAANARQRIRARSGKEHAFGF